MENKELVAPCGLDCFNCGAHESNITDGIRKRLSEMSGKDPSEVSCKGCRATEGKDLPLVGECVTYKCTCANQVDFCYECNNFPCNKLAPCLSKADFAPHNMKMYNLCRIKKVGIDKWIEETKSIREMYSKGEYVPGVGSVVKK